MEEHMDLQPGTGAEPAAQAAEPDFAEFVRQYPDLDAEAIPQSVWEEVRQGDSLLHAYRGHELRQLQEDNRRLQEQLELLQQNARNRDRSLGSVHSAGRAAPADGFLLGFEQA